MRARLTAALLLGAQCSWSRIMKTGSGFALCLSLYLCALPGGAAATPPPAPCAGQPEHRQFDFWLGDWNVEETGVPGKTIASSREEKIIGGCVLLENYTEGSDYTGKSMNFYDPVLKKWRQMWVDSTGSTSEFAGELRDGSIRFEGESHVGSGKRILRKLTFTPLPSGSVRQRSEASLDGKTWKVNYDYTYVPRQPADGGVR